mgnify:CR=1 FL=1
MAASHFEPCPYGGGPWPAASLWNARRGVCHDGDIFTFRVVTFCKPWCPNKQYVIPLTSERERMRALRAILHMVYERAERRLQGP